MTLEPISDGGYLVPADFIDGMREAWCMHARREWLAKYLFDWAAHLVNRWTWRWADKAHWEQIARRGEFSRLWSITDA